MKPYEEINFPNGFLRWLREDGVYVCRMTEKYMEKMKKLHESRPKAREWVGLTDNEVLDMARTFGAQPWPPGSCVALGRMIEAILREKNQ